MSVELVPPWVSTPSAVDVCHTIGDFGFTFVLLLFFFFFLPFFFGGDRAHELSEPELSVMSFHERTVDLDLVELEKLCRKVSR